MNWFSWYANQGLAKMYWFACCTNRRSMIGSRMNWLNELWWSLSFFLQFIIHAYMHVLQKCCACTNNSLQRCGNNWENQTGYIQDDKTKQVLHPRPQSLANLRIVRTPEDTHPTSSSSRSFHKKGARYSNITQDIQLTHDQPLANIGSSNSNPTGTVPYSARRREKNRLIIRCRCK